MTKAYVNYLLANHDAIAIKFGDELVHLGEAADFLAAYSYWRNDTAGREENRPANWERLHHRDSLKVVRGDGLEIPAYLLYGLTRVYLNSASGGVLVVIGYKLA